MKAKQAHDDLIAAAYRAQADALEIEAQAKRRLADEYDAAQERGEIKTQRDNQAFSGMEKASGPELIPPKELHEARIIRDAEAKQPGIVRQTVDAALASGQEPTKASVRRAALKVVDGGKQSLRSRRELKRSRSTMSRPAAPAETQHDRDLAMLRGRKPAALGEGDQISRIAELLQVLLSVDADRFADPDDACEDMMPSIFAFPSPDAKADASTVCAAAKGHEPIIVDFRLAEMIGPTLAPPEVRRSIRTWDRTIKKRQRLCAIVTGSDAVVDAAIHCDGRRWLRRDDGQAFDLLDDFWRQVYANVVRQRCMIREAWRRCDFATEGNA